MKLYKFRQVDTYSLAGLANNTLWFSNMSDFNDPFEGSYILDMSMSDEKWQEVLERFELKPVDEVGQKEQQAMFEELGVTDGGADKKNLLYRMMERDFKAALVDTIHASKVLSMSMDSEQHDPILENLMWSHYADGLRGFCLVFDKDALLNWYYEEKVKLRPAIVEYADKPLSISISDFLDTRYFLNTNPDFDIVEEVSRTIATKSTAWVYENELRLMSLEVSHAHSYPSNSLVEIVIGEKMPKDQQTLVINTAKSANPDIKIKLARLKENTYQLEVVDYESC